MRRVDVAVVGAGPAGISAALAAAQTGAETLLIDEQAEPGGHLRWRIGVTAQHTGGLDIPAGPGPQVARELARRLAEADNLAVESGTVAWGLFEDNVLGVSTEAAADQVQAKSIVLATGSTDIVLPFPGWTLPGVMTARAAQIFMHVHRVLPGWRWGVLGDSEAAGELAHDLEQVGAEIVVRCADVEQIRASGVNRLAHMEIDEDVYEIDSLAIALGRQPDAELAFQAKADGAFIRELGGYTVHRDERGQTSEPGVYIAGDAAGIGQFIELIAEGWLVGLAAAGAPDSELASVLDAMSGVAMERRSTAINRLRPASTGT